MLLAENIPVHGSPKGAIIFAVVAIIVLIYAWARGKRD